MIHVGMINDRVRKVYENQTDLLKDFIKQYKINKLVYYETVTDAEMAIKREKEIREYNREERKRLVETINPKWIDLMDRLIK